MSPKISRSRNPCSLSRNSSPNKDIVPGQNIPIQSFRLSTTKFGVASLRTHIFTHKSMAPTTNRTTLDDLTPQNIGVLKKLNSVLFPVPYSEKFYKESLSVGELAKLGSHPFPLRASSSLSTVVVALSVI